MIFVNKKLIIFVLLATANLFPQSNLQKQYDYASNLFNQEKYFDAITEFKRLQYFDLENQFEYQSNLLIGKSYKAGAKFDEAIKYFTLAEINSKNNEEYFISNILKARTNILRRTTNQAERILNELLIDPKFKSNENEIKYWLGWNYIFADNWKEAYQIFYENNLDTTLANLCKSVDDEMYSVNFAKYSSYVIPGAGQFYTGEYVSGLLSLSWNILAGYLTINSFAEDRVFDGIITGNFLWMRFYSGNTQNAEKFAIQKNLQISNVGLNYLQFKFKGEKP
jgi:tetratricopeptide (TPR) repeat protein